MSFKQPHSVQVVIFSDHNAATRYLLLKRVAREGGFWQTVTGSLEEGETHTQAAIREVKEETGIQCRAEELIVLGLTNMFEIAPHWRPKYSPHVTHNKEVCFALRVDPFDVRIDPIEHEEFRWVDYDTAMALVLWDSTRSAIKTVHGLVVASNISQTEEP